MAICTHTRINTLTLIHTLYFTLSPYKSSPLHTAWIRAP